jgi:hypothetical protein
VGVPRKRAFRQRVKRLKGKLAEEGQNCCYESVKSVGMEKKHRTIQRRMKTDRLTFFTTKPNTIANLLPKKSPTNIARSLLELLLNCTDSDSSDADSDD